VDGVVQWRGRGNASSGCAHRTKRPPIGFVGAAAGGVVKRGLSIVVVQAIGTAKPQLRSDGAPDTPDDPDGIWGDGIIPKTDVAQDASSRIEALFGASDDACSDHPHVRLVGGRRGLCIAHKHNRKAAL
jgi:hypothetical protein